MSVQKNVAPWLGVWIVLSVLITATCVVTSTANAMPGFARKYGVSCYTCHTIFPRLTKLGYEFKRLGYRMPPDVDPGSNEKAIATLDEKIPFNLTNAAAVYLRTSVSSDKSSSTDPEVASTSTNSINLDQVSILFGGAVPESNFSFFGEFLAYEDGGSGLERAKVDWTGGKVGNSYFLGIGKSKVQEGYSASDGMGLTDDDAALGWGTASPNGIMIDSRPGLVEGGYTYMSQDYNYVLGLTAKVTNGLDVNGGDIGNGSQYKHKDFWLAGDFLFGDNASVSVNYYSGKKDTVQNAGTEDEFTYIPHGTRLGFYAHYKAFDHLDMLGGYIDGKEDWQTFVTDPVTSFKTKAYFGEVDLYVMQGFALFGRYDRSDYDSPFAGAGKIENRTWIAGIVKAVARRGFAKVYAQYIDARSTGMDGIETENKQGKLGLEVSW